MSTQPTRPEIDFPGDEPPTELVIEDITVGDGPLATKGHTVRAHYVGVAHSTGEEFDASWNRGDPLEFRLGVGMVIAGWDQGIEGMKVGGRRRLTIPPHLRDAARCCGLSPIAAIRRVELPLALPGIATEAVLTFAHTLGEFGVVLMVGGSIPGETRTIAIAIYDRVQAFDEASAGLMALVLLTLSLLALGITNTLARRMAHRH